MSLKLKFESLLNTISLHLNALNNRISNTVSTENYNTFVNKVNNDISGINSEVNSNKTKLDNINGIKLKTNVSSQKIILSNSKDETLSEIDVSFLNNEGTVLNYNDTTKSLEIKNDSGEILSSIPISNFITGIGNTLKFDAVKKNELQLVNSDNTVVSRIDLEIENINSLKNKLDSIKSIYSDDGEITENRTINIGSKEIKFKYINKYVSINYSGLNISQINANNFTENTYTSIITTNSSGNINSIVVGNYTTLLRFHGNKYIFHDVKKTDSISNKYMILSDIGEVMWTDKVGKTYTAGDGIEITNDDVIKLNSSSLNGTSFNFDWD